MGRAFSLKSFVIVLVVAICSLFAVLLGTVLVVEFTSINSISSKLTSSLHAQAMDVLDSQINVPKNVAKMMANDYVTNMYWKDVAPFTDQYKPMVTYARQYPDLTLFCYVGASGYLAELRKEREDGQADLVEATNPPLYKREHHRLLVNDSVNATQYLGTKLLQTLDVTMYGPNMSWWTGANTPDEGVWLLFKFIDTINLSYGCKIMLNGTFLGLAYADYSLYALTKLLSNINVDASVAIAIVDHLDRLLATNVKGEIVDALAFDKLREISNATSPVLRDAGLYMEREKAANRTITPGVVYSISAGGKTYMFSTNTFLFDPVKNQNWTICLLIPREAFFAASDTGLICSVAAVVVVFGLALLISVYLVTTVSRRIKRIVSQIDGVVTYQDNAFSTSARGDTPRSIFEVAEVQTMQHSVTRMKTILQSFEKYIPVQLLKYLVNQNQPAKLGLERSSASVMFLDVAGFTSIMERVPLSELIEQFTEYCNEAIRIIVSNHGTLDKMMGDGMMAFFGCPPTVLRDHAYWAARCALHLQRMMASFRTKWAREGKVPLHIRIGVASGTVSVGNVGSTQRFQYTVLGDVVNLASRMEGLNKYFGTSILLTGHCYEALRDGFIGRRLGTVRVKGRSNRTRVFELVSHAELFSGECAAYRPLTASQEVPATSRTELLDEAPSARTLDDFTSVRSPIMRARTPPEVPTTPQTPQTPLSEIFISTRSQSPRSRGVQPARVPNEPLFKVIIPAEIERLPRVAIQLYEFCTYFSNAVRLYESRQFNDAIRLVRLYLSVNHALMRAEVHRIEQECYNEANVSAKDQYEPDLATMVQTSMVMSHSQRTRIGLPEGQAGNVGDLHTGEGDYAWDLLQRCEKMRSENVDANWDPVLTMTEK